MCCGLTALRVAWWASAAAYASTRAPRLPRPRARGRGRRRRRDARRASVDASRDVDHGVVSAPRAVHAGSPAGVAPRLPFGASCCLAAHGPSFCRRRPVSGGISPFFGLWQRLLRCYGSKILANQASAFAALLVDNRALVAALGQQYKLSCSSIAPDGQDAVRLARAAPIDSSARSYLCQLAEHFARRQTQEAERVLRKALVAPHEHKDDLTPSPRVET